MKFTKHLVECHCVLPQYRGMKDPIFHKIEVFSTFDDEREENPIDEKFIVCENCGVVHKIIDLCRSEIQIKHESITSVRSISEVSLSLPDNIVKLLMDNNCHISTWEFAEYVYENRHTGCQVIINRQTIDDKIHIKYIVLQENGKFKVKNDVINTIMTW